MGIKTDKLSLTQFHILLWGAMIAPVVELLLKVSTSLSGSGGFLLPILAMPLLVIWGFLLHNITGDGQGFAQGIRQLLGVFLGNILLIFYFSWGIFLLAHRFQVSVKSFLTVGYQEGSLYFLLPVMALFIFWMAGSSLSGFARSATIYFGILCLIQLLVLSLSVSEVELYRVLPLWIEDIPPLATGLFPVLGILGYGFYAVFFLGEVVWPEEGRGRSWVAWSVGVCLLLSLSVFIGIGVFGATLLGEMSQGFLQLSKGIRIEGGFQRMENLVSALLALADFILLGVLLRGTAQCGKIFFPQRPSLFLMGIIVAVSALIALFMPDFILFSQDFILYGNVILAWALPLFLFLLKKCLQFFSKRGRMSIP